MSELDTSYPGRFHDYDVLEETGEYLHIGQCYTEENAQILKCVKCGTKELNVAQDDYYTAVKCPNCGWEVMIHEG